METRFRSPAILAAVFLFAVISVGTVMAYVWTDQQDYSPGSVVTISGDSSGGAGYLARETVNVNVNGPNGYTSFCSGIVESSGAWSCQVTLASDYTAVGNYTYIAVGQTSGVTQSGTFTDDGLNIDSVVVGTQSGTLIYGTTGSATYTVTVTRNSASGDATLNVSGLPSGASYSFSDNPLKFTGNSPNSLTSTLTITTSTTTPAVPSSSFTVQAVGKNTKLGNGILTVNKAQATVTLNNLAQTYTGSALTPAATTSPAGLTIAWTNAPQTNAGSYPVVATVNDQNYAGSASGTFSITKATATVTLGGLTQTYTVSPLTPSAITNPSGLAVTWTGAPQANPGTYSVTASVNDGNYQGSASGTFVISKAEQTIIFGALTDKTYGDSSFAVSATASSGFPVSFAATGACTASGNTVTITGAGTCTVTASQEGDVNYNLAANVPQSFTIRARPITVAADTKTKVYGDADPALTYTYSPSLMDGDSFSGALSRDSGENVGAYDIRQGTLALNGNYDLTFVGAGLTITPKAASVTPDAGAKVYGSSDPALTGTLTGFLPSDGVAAAYSRTAGESVDGSPYTITAVLSPAGVLGNYQIAYNTASFTITPEPVTVTADTQSKTYGDTDPALTYTYSPSLMDGDSFSGALSRVAGENAGVYAIQQGTLTLGSNYAVSYIGADLTIGKADPKVSVSGYSVTYDGDVHAATGTATGPVNIFIVNTTEPLSNVGLLGVGRFVNVTASDVSAIAFPVKISIHYSPAEVAAAGIDESTLAIYYFNTTAASWEKVDGSIVDTVNHVVSAPLAHFSTYGVYGLPLAPTTATIPTQGVTGLQVALSSGDVSASVPSSASGAAAQSKVTVLNSGRTLRYVSLTVDSACRAQVSPQQIDTISTQSSGEFDVTFDCTGVSLGEHPVTYSLQAGDGRTLASQTYRLTISSTPSGERIVTVPDVVILASSMSDMSAGQTGSATVTLKNIGNGSAVSNVTLNVPEGFSVYPNNAKVDLKPGESKNVSFSVTAPNQAGATGYSVLTGFATAIGIEPDGNAKLSVSVDYQTPDGVKTVTRALSAGTNTSQPYTIISIGIIAAIAVLSFFFFRRGRAKR